MAYKPFVPDTPVITQTGVVVVSVTRENLMALRDAIVAGALAKFSVSLTGDPAQPSKITSTNGLERIIENLTWTNGNVTQNRYEYSPDGGTSSVHIGTESITYDSNGNFISTSWS